VNKKLNLDLDALSVDSFETDAAADSTGTVRGQTIPIDTQDPDACGPTWVSCNRTCDSCLDTCDASCNGTCAYTCDPCGQDTLDGCPTEGVFCTYDLEQCY
jgi:hypothetical protein